MTALPLRHPALTEIDWSQWIDLRDAAKRLGESEGHLRRRAKDDLAARYLAMQGRGAAGTGKSRWFVARALDIRLIDGRTGDLHQSPDVSNIPRAKLAQAFARVACVEAMREVRSEAQRAGTPESGWMPQLLRALHEEHAGLKISRSSLFNWDAAYRTPMDLLKLVDRRGRSPKGGADDAAWRAFEDLFLDDRQPSIKSCWSRAAEIAEAEGWTWCTYSTCQRQLHDRIAQEKQMRHREPDRWRKTMQPYIAQDPEAWSAGECWVGDHKQMDMWCRMQTGALVRPWLTAWQDWRTRRIVGWCLSTSPNSSTILAALRHGLLDEANGGGPAVVWIDNGKDYDAWTFHGQTKSQRLGTVDLAVDETEAGGLFHLLGIEAHWSLAYNPNGKSRMERWFRNLEAFHKSFPTYTGRSVDTRPESLVRVLDSPHMAPTFDHVKRRLTAHINGHNANADHQIADLADDGQKLSPDDAMANWRTVRRVMADDSVLELLLQTWSKPTTVGRNGITITVSGRTLSYGAMATELTPFKARFKADRKPVRVSYDPDDLRWLNVYDERWQFVCRATLNEHGGLHGTDAISREHVAKLQKEKATYARSLKHQAEHYATEYETTGESLARIAAADHRPDDPHEPNEAVLKVVQTPLDGESKYAQAAQFRQAVGGEYDEDLDGGLPEIDDTYAGHNQSQSDDELDDFDFGEAASAYGSGGTSGGASGWGGEDDDDPITAYQRGEL